MLAGRDPDRDGVLVVHHHAVGGDVDPPGVGIPHDDQIVGPDIAAAVELVDERDGELPEIDLVVALHVVEDRAFRNLHRRDQLEIALLGARGNCGPGPSRPSDRAGRAPARGGDRHWPRPTGFGNPPDIPGCCRTAAPARGRDCARPRSRTPRRSRGSSRRRRCARAPPSRRTASADRANPRRHSSASPWRALPGSWTRRCLGGLSLALKDMRPVSLKNSRLYTVVSRRCHSLVAIRYIPICVVCESKFPWR